MDVDLRADAAELARFSGKPRELLYELARKGYAHRLQAGRYLISRQPSARPRIDALDPLAAIVMRRLRHDWYLSWHSALWHYGLIEQQSRRICAAVTARKRPAVFGYQSIKFVTLAERKFFGRTQVYDFERPVWMATVEKAIIDSFDLPHLAAPVPVIANALRDAYRDGMLDVEQLVADAIRFASPNLNRRLGFFMDLFDIPGSGPLALRVGRSYAVPLTPGRQPKVGKALVVNRRWRVYEEPSTIGTALELK